MPFDVEVYSPPHDAEDYAFSGEPVPLGSNLAANAAGDDFIFLFTSVAVLFLVFVVGNLLAMGAKKLCVWRLLSFLILLVSFVPILLDFKDVRGYLLGVITDMPEATRQRIALAVAEFTTLTFWWIGVLLVVCAFVLWRLPWTVVLTPPVVSVSYLFPYRRLEQMIYGTYVPVDGQWHLFPIVATLLLCALALGWLWGRSPKNPLPFRAKAFR